MAGGQLPVSLQHGLGGGENTFFPCAVSQKQDIDNECLGGWLAVEYFPPPVKTPLPKQRDLFIKIRARIWNTVVNHANMPRQQLFRVRKIITRKYDAQVHGPKQPVG